MDTRVLLGVDLDLGPATVHMLRTASHLFEPASPQLHLVLLTVIPVPCDFSAMQGRGFVRYISRFPATTEERRRAEQTLRKACATAQRGKGRPFQVELLMRVGGPVEELVKVAGELQVACVVVGSRGESLLHRLRRFFLGSVSREVLHLAPCPVMVVVLPKDTHPRSLVAWYEKAATEYLQEQVSHFTIFTPEAVVRQFPPPFHPPRGQKELVAATRALELLESRGSLICQKMRGEWRCFND